MPDINDLLIRIDSTTEQLRREMRAADQTTKATTTKIQQYLDKVDRRFQRIGKVATQAKTAIAGLVAAFAIRRVSSFIQNQIEVADRIGKSALVAGVAAEQIQELRFAFSQLAGTNDKEVDESLRRFNRRLGLAIDGNKAYLDTFKLLGVELRDSRGQIRDTGEVLEDSLSALSAISNDAYRAAQASQVFGEDAGPRLAAALGAGITEVNRLRQALRAEGGVITDKQVELAAKLNDQFDRLGRLVTAQTASAILDNASAVEQLATAIGRAANATVGATASVVDFVKWLGEELAAQIHGVAANDLPRLTQALTEAQRNLDYLVARQREANDPMLAQQVAQQRALVDALKARLEVGQRLVAKERELAGGSATRPAGRPAPAINPTVELRIPTRDKRRRPLDDAFIDQALDKAKEAQRLFEQTRTETEQLEAQIARVKELAAGGFFESAGVSDEEILKRLNQQLDDVNAKADSASARIGTSLASNVGGAVDELFASGKLSAKNFANSVIRDLLRITAQVLTMKPLIEGIFGAGGGSSAFGKALFSGFGFAKTGSLKVGGSGGPDTQLVPIAATPGETIHVTKQGMGGSGGVTLHTVINAPNATPGTAAMLNAFGKRWSDQTVARVFDEMRRRTISE